MVCYVKWYERSQALTRMTVSKPKVKTTALLLYLLKFDKLMEHQEQSIQEREAIQRSGSASEKNVCTQAILLTSGSGDSINVFEKTAVKVKP